VTMQPVSQPMSPLRQRMLEDMPTRGLRQDTQRDYIRFVRSFADFLRRPPDTATPEDIRRFQVHQAESGVQPQSINCSVSALRFFFTVTLDRPDLSRRFILVRYPRKLPTVLNVEEVKSDGCSRWHPDPSTGLPSALPMVPGYGYQR
jgi:integrase/recombinase XerD